MPTNRGRRLTLAPRSPSIHADADAAAAWVRRQPRPWAVDLFAGCGGLGLGLERAGVRVLAAADADPTALETYAGNLEALTWCGDLSDAAGFLRFLAERGIEHVDVVAGGPPCQPFSRAGRSKIRSLVEGGARDPDDARTALWRSFIAAIDALGPRAVLLENVPELADADGGELLLTLLEALRERGFAVEARMLRADRHGVPQHRRRLFVAARRTGGLAWPSPSPERVDLRAAIDDLPPVAGGQREEALPYGGARSAFQARARAGLDAEAAALVHDHVTRAVREDDREAFELLGPGRTYRDLPARLKRYRDDIFDDKYKRLAWDEVSRSITAHMERDGYGYIHPSQARTLSIREAARIQTFPDSFRFAGHPSVRLRQIGNAVPPALAEAVARSVVRSLGERGPVAEPALARALRRDARTRPARGGGVGGGGVSGDAARDDGARGDAAPGPWSVAAGLVAFGIASLTRAPPQSHELLGLAGTPEATAAALEPLARLVGARRAARLVALAAAVIERHGGSLPRDVRSLRALPGIGEQHATCIRVFGFGLNGLIASRGTRRLVQRLAGVARLTGWEVRLHLLQCAGRRGPDADFNAALLRIVDDVCHARAPDCGRCPLAPECRHALERPAEPTGSLFAAPG